MSKVVKPILGGLGIGGGASEAEKYNTDPTAYKQLYEEALNNVWGAQNNDQYRETRGKLDNSLNSALGELENNAAGRKQNFMEDMSRGFQADTQSLARTKGGTGTLAQAMRMPGSMYDSQSRATSRGLNDLYSQATQDLGSLQGVQGNLYNQDMGAAQSMANLRLQELGSRRGTNMQNLDNSWNAQTAMYGRANQTIGAGMKAAASGGG